MRYKFPFALSVVFTLLACGGSDEGSSENEKLCEDAKAKASECNIASAPQICNSNPSADIVCATRCMVNASCDEISRKVTGNDSAFDHCVVVCSGGNQDDFICADGAHFVAGAAQCDGIAHCPDGSDETGCSAGGTGGSGAGTGGTATVLPPGWASKTEQEKCSAAEENLGALCGVSANYVESCTGDYANFAPIDCEAQQDAYVACLASATELDCQDPCSAQLNGRFACNSAFTQRTGCSRVGSLDEAHCAAPSPYAVQCLGQPPSGCQGDGPTFCCASL